MTCRIFIENKQKEKATFRGYKTLLRRAILKTLTEEGFEGKGEISVSLVSGEEIRRLNADFRGVDRETDVLSFPLEDEDFGGILYLGDIIVCPKVIFSQAKDFGTTYQQEFCLMVIHSTLHLLGYDHMEEAEKKEMFAKQEKILRSLLAGDVKTEG